jgi:signal transduction histidine kinase
MHGVLLTAAFEDRHFFELAATVMPIVLFGSVLARAFRPPETNMRLRWYHGVWALAIALYIAFVSAAEVFAIAAAVSGGADDLIGVVVTVALVLGIFGFGLAITIPWAIRFAQTQQTHLTATVLLGILFLLTFAWGSLKLLELATRGTVQTNQAERIDRALEAASSAELAWLRAEIQAHSDQKIKPLEKQELQLLSRLKLAAKQNERALLAANAR